MISIFYRQEKLSVALDTEVAYFTRGVQRCEYETTEIRVEDASG